MDIVWVADGKPILHPVAEFATWWIL